MTSSDTGTPGLAAALAAVQAELPPVTKNKTADVRNKEGKFLYAYKYADLADVSAAVMPLLGKNGLSFSCQPTMRGSEFGLAYQLLHSSGELIDGWYPLDARMSPQQIGGHITYARRYCLCAITGVAAEEDTDGVGAEAAHKPASRGKPPERAAGNQPANRDGSTSRSQVTDAELDATGQMTGGQIREHNKLERDVKGTGPQGAQRLAVTPPDDPFYEQPAVRAPKAAGSAAQAIAMHFGRLGIADRDVRLGMTGALIGRPIASSNDMTAYEGLAVKRALERCRDEKAFKDLLEHGADALRAEIPEHAPEAVNA